MAALRLPRRYVLAGGIMVLLGYLLLALIPEIDSAYPRATQDVPGQLRLSGIIFGTLGVLFTLTLGACLLRLLPCGRLLLRRASGPGGTPQPSPLGIERRGSSSCGYYWN